MKRGVLWTLMMICLSYGCFAESVEEAPAQHEVTPVTGGSFQSTHGQRAYNDARFFISQVLKTELQAQEDAAFRAYVHESPAIGAWALEELIRAYARNGLILQEVDPAWDRETTGRRMHAHARLYKLYTSMKKDRQAQRHLEEAIRISDGLEADAIMKLVGHLDSKQSE